MQAGGKKKLKFPVFPAPIPFPYIIRESGGLPEAAMGCNCCCGRGCSCCCCYTSSQSVLRMPLLHCLMIRVVRRILMLLLRCRHRHFDNSIYKNELNLLPLCI